MRPDCYGVRAHTELINWVMMDPNTITAWPHDGLPILTYELIMGPSAITVWLQDGGVVVG